MNQKLNNVEESVDESIESEETIDVHLLLLEIIGGDSECGVGIIARSRNKENDFKDEIKNFGLCIILNLFSFLNPPNFAKSLEDHSNNTKCCKNETKVSEECRILLDTPKDKLHEIETDGEQREECDKALEGLYD